MSKTIKIIGNRTVTVVSSDSSSECISETDKEMDVRAVAAVKYAIKRANICKKPIAKYDAEEKKAYIITANGEKTYVG